VLPCLAAQQRGMKACVEVASSQWSVPHPAQVATQWLPLARGGLRGVLQAMQ
jgi:hypothetical protein